jgi:hypothetical protein
MDTMHKASIATGASSGIARSRGDAVTLRSS